MIPFHIAVPDSELADLWERLLRTRWPDDEPVADWSQGVPIAYLRELCHYWATDHDWRATERRLKTATHPLTQPPSQLSPTNHPTLPRFPTQPRSPLP